MKIKDFKIGEDGVFIVAEMSANHNGSLEDALLNIQAAKDIGANAIKLQTYTADTITLNSNNKDFIIEGGTLWDGQTMYDLYQKAHTPWEWHEELFNYAREIGIDIFSTPFDKSAVDFLEQFKPTAYKIASFEITDYELVRYVASKGKPTIISTGIATIGEIEDVIDICRSEGNNNIALLKCTSSYPSPVEDANLITIPNLAERFGVISGFSDHTMGVIAPIVATALGASIIEKHFIVNKSIGGPDSTFSLDKKEFAQMIRAIRDTEKLIGKVDYRMTEKKKKSRLRFARSLYVAEDIEKGGIFSEENIRSVRPGHGMHPKNLRSVLGKVAEKAYKFGERYE